MLKPSQQADVRSMVSREVHYCVSNLIFALASECPYDAKSDLAGLTEQASELCYPIDDFEEAAIQEGWTRINSDHPNDYTFAKGDEKSLAEDWEDLCDVENIEPYQREIFEHWIVSDWLAGKLGAKGERVDRDFAGLTVWGRTTTGQAIYMDSVIETIWCELHAGKVE